MAKINASNLANHKLLSLLQASNVILNSQSYRDYALLYLSFSEQLIAHFVSLVLEQLRCTFSLSAQDEHGVQIELSYSPENETPKGHGIHFIEMLADRGVELPHSADSPSPGGHKGHSIHDNEPSSYLTKF